MIYPRHIPRWAGRLFSRAWWHRPDPDGIYLTFDDGPTPGITDELLSRLELARGKATFFTVGEQASRFPELLMEVAKAGHSIGNHTYQHLKAHKTPMSQYLEDISRTDRLLVELGIRTRLFRPPYGILTPAVYRTVPDTHRIVMWSWLTGDFDPKASPERFARSLSARLKPGTILVLHDSARHGERMFRFLDPILSLVAYRGWKLKSLPQEGRE